VEESKKERFSRGGAKARRVTNLGVSHSEALWITRASLRYIKGNSVASSEVGGRKRTQITQKKVTESKNRNSRGGAEKYKFKKQKGFCFHPPRLRVTTSFPLNVGVQNYHSKMVSAFIVSARFRVQDSVFKRAHCTEVPATNPSSQPENARPASGLNHCTGLQAVRLRRRIEARKTAAACVEV
jgi:hypothetical protein